MHTKYMTVEHHEDTHLKIVGKQVTGKIPVHDLLCDYYWTRLDANHVILLGNHFLSTHTALMNHPKTVVLPYIAHRKKIKDHFAEKGKMGHHKALSKNLSLHEDATMQDMIDTLVEKHGIVFSPKI